MYLYANKVKASAIKGNPVDQSSCKSFSELIPKKQNMLNQSVDG